MVSDPLFREKRLIIKYNGDKVLPRDILIGQYGFDPLYSFSGGNIQRLDRAGRARASEYAGMQHSRK